MRGVSAPLISPVLVGRDQELRELLDALELALGGQPSIVLLGGEAGVGKTRLVEEARRRAEERGARVLIGACVELSGDGIPLAALVDALRTLSRSTPEHELDALLGPARAELARLLPELGPADGPRPAANASGLGQLLELVLGLVGRLADERPLVLVLEDLQWADRSTLELAALLVRGLRHAPVLLVLTYRSDEVHRGHPLRTLVTGWERVRTVRRLQLERFARDGVAAQLRGILGDAPREHLVDQVYERSEGNAFLVEEILGAVRSGADPDYLPPSLRDVLLARTERLSAPAQEVLRTVSAAGRWVSDPLLAAVSTMDDDTRHAALRETVDHHLLVIDDSGRGFAFRHALARAAVYDDALPGERVGLHTAYGEALAADGALASADAPLAASLAFHWNAAHDLPRALEASIEAGRQVAGARAAAEAAQHFERALELWPRVPDAEERTGIDHIEALDLAARAAFAAGEPERTISLLDEALREAADGEAPERCAMLLGWRALALNERGRPEDAATTFDRAVALLDPDRPSVERATLLAWQTRALMRRSRQREAEEVGTQAVAAARAAAARSQEADALVSLGCAQVFELRPEGWASLEAGLALAEEIGDDETALRARINLADSLQALGHYEQSATVSSAGLADAQRVGLSRVMGAYLTNNLAEALISLGRWDEAQRVLDDALAGGVAGVVGSGLRELRASIALHRGRDDAAQLDVRDAKRILGGSDEAQYSQPLAFLEAELLRRRGDLAGARDVVSASLAGDAASFAGRYAAPLLWLGVRVEGDAGQAARDARQPLPAGVLDRAAELCRLFGSLVVDSAVLRGYIALATAELTRVASAGDVETWRAAVAACEEAGEPHQHGYALLRLAEAAVAGGDRDAAADAVRRGLTLVEPLRSTLVEEELRSLARRARLPLAPQAAEAAPEADGEPFGLTDRERDVLDLVAAGRTNGQIAQVLFISPKTVSVHVSNILGKLGVSGRVEAAAVAHRLGLLREPAQER
jgi:DNA-binding CsgD family transcriptional regulator/tetratricopeptide (TPR) repeat protein